MKLNILALLTGPIWLGILILSGERIRQRDYDLVITVACAISIAAFVLLKVFQGPVLKWHRENTANLPPKEKRFGLIGLLIGPFVGFAKILYQGHLPKSGYYNSEWPEFLISIIGISVVSGGIGLLIARSR